MPTRTLEQARESLRRLGELDAEYELVRSRIGGQGTGMGPMIDHTTTLDPMRKVDECMEYEREMSDEAELCREDVERGWVLLFGADALMESDGVDPVMREAVMHALVLHYLYGRSWYESCTNLRYGTLDGRKVADATLRWMESRGTAHLKAALGM